MPKCAIVYFSQEGSTAKVASSISRGLKAGGYQVDLCNIKNEIPPDLNSYDLLGIGMPVYYFKPPFNVMDYVQSLPELNGIPVFFFILHGAYVGNAGKLLSRNLIRKGAKEVGSFYSYGASFFLGYLKRGFLFSNNHPSVDELARAEDFGYRLATNTAEKPVVNYRFGIIYRLEQALTSRWLVQHIYSRMFINTKKCNACDLCIKQCPTKNIVRNKNGRLVWGRNCLLCLTCEMKCSNEAIISPVSMPFFRLFLIYNVNHASKDANLDYATVTHKQGRIKQL